MGYHPQIVRYGPKTLLKVISAHQDDPSLCPITKRPTKLQKSKIFEKKLFFQRWGGQRGWGGKRWGVGRPPNIKKFVLMFFFNFLLLSSKILLRFFSRSFWSESEILKKKHKKSLQKKSVEKGAFLAFLGHF